jgi:phosphoglycerate dehydrogenase-like enzyme
MATLAALPGKGALTICFAHVAYQMQSSWERRHTGIRSFEVRTREDLDARIADADVLVVSGLWHNGLVEAARRLRFIQSIGAGYDQFPLDELRRRGVRLASARGVNRNAVSEHTFALILALARDIHAGRDNQHRHFWRGMISNPSQREDELAGKTIGIIGMGAIGSRVATLAKAFEMRVIATKRNPATAEGPADEVLTPDHLPELLRQADFVVLNCPLTPETRGIINAAALAEMKPSAYLINVARGGCVDEQALLDALRTGRIAGAALDHFQDDPLPESSPFWDLQNVIITPHTAGETGKYEDNVLDILVENLERLWRGQQELHNQVV